MFGQQRTANKNAAKADGDFRPGFAQIASVSLPRSGSAIRGMNEQFPANSVKRSESITVPIALYPVRSGFGPVLSRAYDSGNGDSPFRFEWSVTTLHSATRKTVKDHPQYLYVEERYGLSLPWAEVLDSVLVTSCLDHSKDIEYCGGAVLLCIVPYPGRRSKEEMLSHGSKARPPAFIGGLDETEQVDGET